MAQDDDDYHLAGLEAYNTWMHDEFMAAAPERLIGLAQMPGVDIQTSVKWLRDAKAAGYKGVIISAYPSGNATLSDEDDAFWEVAEEEQMPVHIHSGLRQAGGRTAGSFQKAAASAGRAIGLAEMGGAVGDASGFMSKFIYSGIYDRFPGLQCVAVECGAGWIPHFLEHMDDHYWRNRTWTKTTLKMLPSEYFRRNWKATFIREPFAVATRHWIGVDNLMWSTDYPHHRNDWPYSRRIVEESSWAGYPLQRAPAHVLRQRPPALPTWAEAHYRCRVTGDRVPGDRARGDRVLSAAHVSNDWWLGPTQEGGRGPRRSGQGLKTMSWTDPRFRTLLDEQGDGEDDGTARRQGGGRHRRGPRHRPR